MRFTYRLSNKYSDQDLAWATWLGTDTADSRTSFAYASCDLSDATPAEEE